VWGFPTVCPRNRYGPANLLHPEGLDDRPVVAAVIVAVGKGVRSTSLDTSTTQMPAAGRRWRSEDLSRPELARHSTQADQRPTVFYLPHVAQPMLVHEALQYLELADRVAGSHDHAAEDVLQSWLAIVGSRCVSITSPTPASRASSATSRVEM